MDAKSAISIIRALSSLSWRWDEPSWRAAAQQLGLRESRAVRGRISYLSPENETLSAYFDGDRLEFVEVTLDLFRDPELLSEEGYTEKIAEFREKFEELVGLTTALLGDPVFCGPSSAEEFPEDQDALRLALWPVREARLMIEQKHEDKELPIRVSVVLAPA